MNRTSENKILDYIGSMYGQIDLIIHGNNYKIIAVNVKRSGGGIKYMLCFTFFSANGYIYSNRGIPAMPLSLFPFISKCKIVGYFHSINSIPFKLWFEEPLTNELLKNISPILDKPEK